MALQIEVSTVDTYQDSEGNTVKAPLITLNLKCWIATADPKTDDPVIDINRSAAPKKSVEGVTSKELMDRVTHGKLSGGNKSIMAQFQDDIDEYKKRVAGLVDADTAAVKNGLVG